MRRRDRAFPGTGGKKLPETYICQKAKFDPNVMHPPNLLKQEPCTYW